MIREPIPKAGTFKYTKMAIIQKGKQVILKTRTRLVELSFLTVSVLCFSVSSLSRLNYTSTK